MNIQKAVFSDTDILGIHLKDKHVNSILLIIMIQSQFIARKFNLDTTEENKQMQMSDTLDVFPLF